MECDQLQEKDAISLCSCGAARVVPSGSVELPVSCLAIPGKQSRYLRSPLAEGKTNEKVNSEETGFQNFKNPYIISSEIMGDIIYTKQDQDAIKKEFSEKREH